MQTTEIIIANVLQTGTAFAVMADDTTQAIFIPSKVAVAADVYIGQVTKAVLIPNTAQPEKTPWLAVLVLKGDAAPAPVVDALANEIKADLERGAATASDVAQSIGKPVELVARKMREMSSDGVLVQDIIYALTLDDLLPSEDV
jgi:hypothetical protein